MDIRLDGLRALIGGGTQGIGLRNCPREAVEDEAPGAVGLVDALETSDDYLIRAMESSDLYRISFHAKPTLQQRVLSSMRATVDEAALWVSQRNQESRFH